MRIVFLVLAVLATLAAPIGGAGTAAARADRTVDCLHGGQIVAAHGVVHDHARPAAGERHDSSAPCPDMIHCLGQSCAAAMPPQPWEWRSATTVAVAPATASARVTGTAVAPPFEPPRPSV